MKQKSHLFLCLLFTVLNIDCLFGQTINNLHDNNHTLSLDGIWKFKLDPFSSGISENGVQLLPQMPEQITLPGSTDEAGKGYKTQGMISLRLTREFEYKGAAWYEKEVSIPEEWKDKDVQLFLERVHWQTDLWVNNKPAGKRESLSTPHLYDISSLIKPGVKNNIRIRVDNSMIYNIEYSQAISEQTQTDWNGIIGKIQLRAFDKVHIKDIQVYPDAAQKMAKVEIVLQNSSKIPVKGTLVLEANSNNNSEKIPSKNVDFSGSDSLITVITDLSLGSPIQLWDEFHPNLYHLKVIMKADAGNVINKDSGSVRFGAREIGTKGTRFVINGNETFMRLTVNSSEFPLTGYPSMDVASWFRILKTAKDYGLNGMRFHSWCPPEAAFEAADSLGMYLQVENSDWRFTVGKDSAVNRFLTEEADRILKVYGNHPSFMMLCEGNELVGPGVQSFLSGLVARWKKEDPRHLYTSSSGYPVVEGNQYNDYYGARPQHWKEGLKGRFNVKPLDTWYDYSDYVAKFKVPMITHEIGQWCVYPNFNEILKYTGVLKPYNYQLFRELLRDAHMLNQADAFTIASGKFQVIQKKEEIESYLRTPGMGGYSLLQLEDFPGQGTAPVGVVDIFWDPKPYVSAHEFSRFENARVPLLRTSSFTWTNDQSFQASIQFANFGEAAMKGVSVHWTLQFPDKTIYAEGNSDRTDIPLGSPVNIQDVAIPLNKIQKATRLDFIVTIPGTDYSNSWSIWVYPKQLPKVDSKKVLIAYNWDKRAKDYLQKGGKVLLLPDTSNIKLAADPVFSGISWNTVWSGMPPNLLGILCDPSNPALKNFPTQFHSNWQWWDITRHAKPMILDHFPFSFKPIIQMIPDWNNPHKIGLVFEAKVGKGSLLVSAVDLRNNMDKRPVARQLLYSLKEYANSENFKPQTAVDIEMIDKIFNN